MKEEEEEEDEEEEEGRGGGDKLTNAQPTGSVVWAKQVSGQVPSGDYAPLLFGSTVVCVTHDVVTAFNSKHDDDSDDDDDDLHGI